MEDYFWKDDNTIVVGGKEFSVRKSGAEYAQQFGRLTGWLGTHAISALAEAQASGIINVGSDEAAGLNLFSYMLGEGITPEAMIELSAILLGCEYKFAEKHFDPGWLVETALVVVEMPGIQRAFQRVWQRFFLASSTDEVSEEDQAQDQE